MAILTKGTKLYTIDPDTSQVLTVGCATAVTGIDSKLDQIETTCLSDLARTYVAGLATPGDASFTINFDPADASHTRLHALKVAGTTLHWAVGWGDGTADPTADSNGTFNLPTSRSWITFDGFMNSFPFAFALNAVVTSNVSIQVSGDPEVIAKS